MKKHLLVSTCLLFTAALSTDAFAQTVTFDFRGATGLTLESASSVAVSGLTLSTSVFPNGVFNQTASGFGVNADGGTDDSDEFDTNEGFTFSFDQAVRLVSLSVSSFGGGSAALLAFDGGATIASISSTGVTALADTAVTANTLLRFTGTGTSPFSLDSLSVTAIPEPASAGYLGGFALLCALRRRRRTA
jgi:hypothetical protein